MDLEKKKGLLVVQQLVCFDPPCSACVSLTLLQLKRPYALQWFGVHVSACLMPDFFLLLWELHAAESCLYTLDFTRAFRAARWC